MFDAITDASLMLQVRAAADTVLFKQVGGTPTVFERVASVASGLMSIALLALTIVLIPAAWNFRKSYKKVNELLKRIYGDLNPIMRHASTIADNVDYITTSIRTDVQQLNATIATANQRLHQAMAITEQRLQEFNALLQVVQEEAEGMFVSTASTVRGVRTGAAAFRDGIGTDLAIEDDDDLDETEVELMNDLEDTDGNDRSIRNEPRASTLDSGVGGASGPSRPRVRRARRENG
jgi:uncharacterized protein YoxC